MYRQAFRTEDLKSALEDALGFKIESFVRLGGGGAVNFKAKRARDGLSFVVKCFPPDRYQAYEFLSKTLRILQGVKTPCVLFDEKCPDEFAHHKILCLAWQDGEVIRPDQLTDGQWIAFLDDYKAFSDRLQSIRTDDPVLPVRGLWVAARASCRGLRGRLLRSALDKMQEDELDYRPGSAGCVHGDFHRGNLLFKGGGLSCIMDLESVRRGHPAEDICALLLISARRLQRSEKARLQRLLELFRLAIARLGYPPYVWRSAINALYVRTLCRKTDGLRKMGFLKILEMYRRAKTSNLFRQQVG